MALATDQLIFLPEACKSLARLEVPRALTIQLALGELPSNQVAALCDEGALAVPEPLLPHSRIGGLLSFVGALAMSMWLALFPLTRIGNLILDGAATEAF